MARFINHFLIYFLRARRLVVNYFHGMEGSRVRFSASPYNKMGYSVVFENTGKANSAYSGIRTWMSFQDRNDFEKWYQGDRQINLSVLAEGIDDGAAYDLARKTPKSALFAVAFDRAVISENPFFIDELTLNTGLSNINHAR